MIPNLVKILNVVILITVLATITSLPHTLLIIKTAGANGIKIVLSASMIGVPNISKKEITKVKQKILVVVYLPMLLKILLALIVNVTKIQISKIPLLINKRDVALNKILIP